MVDGAAYGRHARLTPAPGVTSALRLEAMEAGVAVVTLRAWSAARPDAGGMVESIAGGVALYGGAGSPLSQAVGIGMNGPVRAEDLTRLEEFFRTRGSAVTISLCPLSHHSLIEAMARSGGYRISHFENTLARTLGPESLFNEVIPEVDARRAQEEESELWARTVMRGFAEGADPPSESVAMMAMYAGGAAWLAEVSGRIAAGGAMSVHEGGAMLYGDGTIPEFRGKGAQRALIQGRLREAAGLGCDLAMACTLPGSVSQRNYERYGFRVAYTKVLMVKEWPE